MMKTEPVATTVSVSDKVATYFVVPVIPNDGSTENVLYYEEVPDTEKWKKVSSKDLNARGQHRNAGKIKLLQPTVDAIIAHTDLRIDMLDQTVHLYAGVAKTLLVSDDLESVYTLGHDQSLTIPVIADTARGLILVFTKAPAVGSRPYPITKLIATTDPEIKNSVGSLVAGAIVG